MAGTDGHSLVRARQASFSSLLAAISHDSERLGVTVRLPASFHGFLSYRRSAIETDLGFRFAAVDGGSFDFYCPMMLAIKKAAAPLLICLALVGGLAIGYFVGRGGTKESYEVPVKNTCGPDALSAALAEFKIEAPPKKIAELAGTDSQGTTMLGLKQAAESFGTKAVGLRLSQKELESYVQKGAGVIAFVNGDHYVWIKNAHPRGMVVKDAQPGFQFIPFEKWYPMWFEAKGGKIPDANSGHGVCLIVYPKADSKS
ncbi:MAG: cysteine peptidase family C39 domain-containing protein [Acidobacteria bacterium]|nr:cysteine peptidase family C39 domain-containing protein [Acidobacteriota bacterium]